MSKKDMKPIALTEIESPTDAKKSKSTLRVRKALTPKVIANTMKFDSIHSEVKFQKMNSCKNSRDQEKFNKFTDYYNMHMTDPLVKMQSETNQKSTVFIAHNPIKSFKNAVDYSNVTPVNNKDRSHFNESIKITETNEKTESYLDQFSSETKSVDNIRNSVNVYQKARLSVDLDHMDLNNIDQISEQPETSSSSNSQIATVSVSKKVGLEKNKKYYNFLKTFEEKLQSPEMEKKSSPMIRIDIQNNYILNDSQTIKSQKEEGLSENWFLSGIIKILGCGCGGDNI